MYIHVHVCVGMCMIVCMYMYMCVRGGEMRKHSYNVQMVRTQNIAFWPVHRYVCNYDINMFVVQPTCSYIHVHVVPTCSSNALMMKTNCTRIHKSTPTHAVVLFLQQQEIKQ